jgi:hypothetical protein
MRLIWNIGEMGCMPHLRNARENIEGENSVIGGRTRTYASRTPRVSHEAQRNYPHDDLLGRSRRGGREHPG